MAFAETANLAIKLTVGGNFKSALNNASSSLKKLDRDASRAFKAGTQIGVGIKRGAYLAIGAIGTLTGLIALSVKEGQNAANVQKVYAVALTNSAHSADSLKRELAALNAKQAGQKQGSAAYNKTAKSIALVTAQLRAAGPVSADYVKKLNDQQEALLNLAGVDDELIKTEQTRLIQMGFSGKAVLKATPLILDLAEATGIDLLTATKAVGKAANGNAGALQRYGVFVDKARFKTDPFTATMDALNKKFGGTTRALSGSLDTRLKVFHERLANIREEAGIKLLPVLTRIVDMAGQKLVPAFGKFVDRILPEINKGLNEFADALQNGGAEEAIRGITDALGPMIELVKIAAAPVKAIVTAFLSLPKGIQTVLVGAFAVNKLTGGLVTNAAGGLVEAVGKAFLNGIKAPIVNVEGGVVNVGGVPGAGGIGGQVAGAAGGITAATVGIIAAAAVASTWAFLQTANGSKAGPGSFTPTIGSGLAPKTVKSSDFTGIDWAKVANGLKNTGHAGDDIYRASTGVVVGLGRASDDIYNAAAKTTSGLNAAAAAAAKAGNVFDKSLYQRVRAMLGYTVKDGHTVGGHNAIASLATLKGSDLVALARSLSQSFAHSQAPFYRSAKNQERATLALARAAHQAAARGDTRTAAAIRAAIRNMESRVTHEVHPGGKEQTQKQISAKADALRQAQLATHRAVEYGAARTASAATAAGHETATALRHLPVPTTNIKINVSVTPGAIQKSTTIQTSYGPANGSSGSTDNGIPNVVR